LGATAPACPPVATPLQLTRRHSAHLGLIAAQYYYDIILAEVEQQTTSRHVCSLVLIFTLSYDSQTLSVFHTCVDLAITVLGHVTNDDDDDDDDEPPIAYLHSRSVRIDRQFLQEASRFRKIMADFLLVILNCFRHTVR